MACSITAFLIARIMSKVGQILKFKSWTSLRLTAVIAISWQLGLDLCPVSPANDADPALRPHYYWPWQWASCYPQQWQ